MGVDLSPAQPLALFISSQSPQRVIPSRAAVMASWSAPPKLSSTPPHSTTTRKPALLLSPKLFVASNVFGGPGLTPSFAESAAESTDVRSVQWERAVASRAAQRTCHVFPTESQYHEGSPICTSCAGAAAANAPPNSAIWLSPLERFFRRGTVVPMTSKNQKKDIEEMRALRPTVHSGSTHGAPPALLRATRLRKKQPVCRPAEMATQRR